MGLEEGSQVSLGSHEGFDTERPPHCGTSRASNWAPPPAFVPRHAPDGLGLGLELREAVLKEYVLGVMSIAAGIATGEPKQ